MREAVQEVKEKCRRKDPIIKVESKRIPKY